MRSLRWPLLGAIPFLLLLAAPAIAQDGASEQYARVQQGQWKESIRWLQEQDRLLPADATLEQRRRKKELELEWQFTVGLFDQVPTRARTPEMTSHPWTRLAWAVAGWTGGAVDNLLMRLVDVMLSLPTLFVILVASKFLGNGTVMVVIVIFGLFSWMGVSRLVRSLFLSIREREFVEAATAVGVSDQRITFRHILPNAFSPIVVSASLIVAGNIISEAFVSFLGFGVDPTSPTWGNILSGGLQFIALGNWWWPLFPGLAIILTVLAVNFVGDGLRDAFDPRSRA